MNFREAVQPGMTSMEYLDIPHDERYESIVNAIGYEDVKQCIPYSLERLKKEFEKDKFMNGTSIEKWDMAAGFICKYGNAKYIGSRLTNLYRRIGVDTFSCSDGVCILKCCARMWIKESENGGVADESMQ